jgi:hypothetical protein
LIPLSWLAMVLATVAAANLALIYLLFTVDHPGSDLSGFLPIMAIGTLPFLVPAGLFAWVIGMARASAEGSQVPRQVLGRVRAISGFGLPFMIVGGFWAGLGAAFLGLEQGSPAGYALMLYQFTFLAAVLADGVTLVVALRTRAAP